MIDWELLHLIAKVALSGVQLIGVPSCVAVAVWMQHKDRYEEAILFMAWAIFLKV